MSDRDKLIDAMCLTWRTDFGLPKFDGMSGAWIGNINIENRERSILRRKMRQLLDHHGAAIARQFAQAEPVQSREAEYRSMLERWLLFGRADAGGDIARHVVADTEALLAERGE